MFTYNMYLFYSINFIREEEGIEFIDLPLVVIIHNTIQVNVALKRDMRGNTTRLEARDPSVSVSVNDAPIAYLPHNAIFEDVSAPEQGPPYIGRIRPQGSRHYVHILKVS